MDDAERQSRAGQSGQRGERRRWRQLQQGSRYSQRRQKNVACVAALPAAPSMATECAAAADTLDVDRSAPRCAGMRRTRCKGAGSREPLHRSQVQPEQREWALRPKASGCAKLRPLCVAHAEADASLATPQHGHVYSNGRECCARAPGLARPFADGAPHAQTSAPRFSATSGRPCCTPRACCSRSRACSPAPRSEGSVRHRRAYAAAR